MQADEWFHRHVSVGVFRDCIGKERLEKSVKAGKKFGEIHAHVHSRWIIKVG